MAKLSTSAFIRKRLFFLDLHWVIGRNFGTKEITKYQERNLFFRFFILSYLMFVKMNNSEVIK